MTEMEVKILEINKDNLVTKIEILGGKKIFEGEISAEFFRNKENKKLRLRRMDNKTILTYKERITHEKIREEAEFEVIVEDYDTVKIILMMLGFEIYRTSYKKRISYQIGNIHYDIDKYDGIPRFIEVESNNIKDVEKGVSMIGYSFLNTTTMTETQLREYYNMN